MTTGRYYWLPSFLESSNPHGGNNRSLQIAELLGKSGVSFETVSNSTSASFPKRCFWAVERILRTWRLPTRFPSGFTKFSLDYGMIRNLIEKDRLAEAIVWESIYEPKTSNLLRRKSRRLIIVPQNIEALVSFRCTNPLLQLKRFGRELLAYREADTVFTISPEEAWLLQLLGVKACTLPYYPPAPVRIELEKVRQSRLASVRENHVLCLGSLTNPPTLQGTKELTKLLSAILTENDPRLIIAGNGSECMADRDRPIHSEVLGQISQSALDHLRGTTRALVVHHVATTGIVTRVVDAIYAGIPVIANEHAARGWGKLEGVYVYRNHVELADLIRSPLPIPNHPSRPQIEENQFLGCVLGNTQKEYEVG